MVDGSPSFVGLSLPLRPMSASDVGSRSTEAQLALDGLASNVWSFTTVADPGIEHQALQQVQGLRP